VGGHSSCLKELEDFFLKKAHGASPVLRTGYHRVNQLSADLMRRFI
jgi:hypothetical protein